MSFPSLSCHAAADVVPRAIKSVAAYAASPSTVGNFLPLLSSHLSTTMLEAARAGSWGVVAEARQLAQRPIQQQQQQLVEGAAQPVVGHWHQAHPGLDSGSAPGTIYIAPAIHAHVMVLAAQVRGWGRGVAA